MYLSLQSDDGKLALKQMLDIPARVAAASACCVAPADLLARCSFAAKHRKWVTDPAREFRLIQPLEALDKLLGETLTLNQLARAIKVLVHIAGVEPESIPRPHVKGCTVGS